MGGCKCIFRDCENKSSNNSSVHFFHFPVKHPEKLKKWVKYADAENVLKLEKNQVKNRVVCSAHFRDECFMNYKRNRITQTAIPTLVILYEDEDGKVALDYETSDCPEPIRILPTRAKHLLPPKSKNLEEKVLNNNKRVLNGQELNVISAKKEKLLDDKNYNLKIIDQNSTEIEIIKELKCTKIDNIVKVNIEPFEVKDITENMPENLEENIIYENDYFLKPEENCTLQKNTENLPDVEDNKNEELQSVAPKTELEKQTIKVLGRTIEILKNESEEKIRGLEQELKLKKLEIRKLKSKERKYLIEQEKLRNSATCLNKEQLFNLIKKYLCPSMSSLVRMEMFGNPEREWNDDEKDIAVELLQLGESVFSFFRDEWRFRLPPQKDVEQWLQEK